MDKQKFFNLLPSFIGKIDVDGIIIKHNGNFITTPYSQRHGVQVPVFSIENPNDIPYTKESLSMWLTEEVIKFRDFVSIEKLGPSLTYFIEFDDSIKDLYIPKQIKEQIDNCLESKDFDKVAWRNPENIRVVGEFKKYNQFDMEGDRITWHVDFKPSKIEIVDEKGNFKSSVNKEDYNYIFETLMDDMDFFESKIWSCVQPTLSSKKTFVDFDWMSWYTYVDNVNY